MYGRFSNPGIGNYPPRRRRDLEVGPRETFISPCGFMSSSPSAISEWGWGTHTVRSGMDPGDRCFCPRVVGVVMYEMIPDPWRWDLILSGFGGVRRELDVGLRVNSRSAPAL